MRVLSLFSGIGAHDLGLEWAGFEIVGQVEIDEFCQKILKKHFPKAKRWTDICAVTANDIRRRCGRIDLITGGFPCQDISTAGKQKGLVEGERSGLWREMWRLIRDLRPDWLLLENVPALRTKGGDNILAALEGIGYTCWPLVVGAVHADAPHIRKRTWIVCHYSGERRKGRKVAARSEGQCLRHISRAMLPMELANSNGEPGRATANETGSTLVASISIESKLEGDGLFVRSEELVNTEDSRRQTGGGKQK